MITGANQGGKSMFLRSLGIAQLMLQCGMFVPARSFSADLRSGVFTHLARGRRRDAARQVRGGDPAGQRDCGSCRPAR